MRDDACGVRARKCKDVVGNERSVIIKLVD
jgi:hypothetical protein